MASSAQHVIPTSTHLHPTGTRVLVALIALAVVTVFAITSWSAMTQAPATSPVPTGSAQEAYDWSASRPGGSMYNAQVPRQAGENFAALRPGGSVYDSQVPAAARDN
jgi:hypothetical protein